MQQTLLHRLGVFQDEDTTTYGEVKRRLGVFHQPMPEAGSAARPQYLRPHSKEINEVSRLNLNAGGLGREPCLTFPGRYIKRRNLSWHRISEEGLLNVCFCMYHAQDALLHVNCIADATHIPYLHYENHHGHEYLSTIMHQGPPRLPPPPPPPPGTGVNTQLPGPHNADVTSGHGVSGTAENQGEQQARTNARRETTNPRTPGPMTSECHPEHDPNRNDDQGPRARQSQDANRGPGEPSTKRPATAPNTTSQRHVEREPIDLTHPYVHLLTGYFWPKKPGDASRWQPRRSLDGYLHNHPATTRRRDQDQVVLRYTRANHLPERIFMVDQLWVWILRSGEYTAASQPFLL